MKVILDNYKIFFYNDDEDKYIKYLNIKIKNIKDEDEKKSCEVALKTGKYIVNMVSDTCTNCGIRYSVPVNSIVWYCPSCDTLMSWDSEMILPKDVLLYIKNNFK